MRVEEGSGMFTECMKTSKTCEWETPQWLFDMYNEDFQFEVDVCALPENAKCKKYFTPTQDGLKQDQNRQRVVA